GRHLGLPRAGTPNGRPLQRARPPPTAALPRQAPFPQGPGLGGRAGACVELIWRRASKGLQRSRFLALRVRPAGITPRRQAARHSGGELPVRWLLVEWPTDKPEPVKYWLANLPEATP